MFTPAPAISTDRAPESRWSGPGRWRLTADIALAAVLFAIALVLRRRHLLAIPAFADEGLEVLWARAIAQGTRLPLTGYDAYDGPLFAYLTAIALRVFGSDIAVPRALVALCGALTAPMAFWLGTVMSGRLAGLLTGIAVIASPALVLYSSHYAWSNSLTPLFATATFACLSLAVTRHDRVALAASGALAALTVQTHPIAAVAMAGAALWLLQIRRTQPWLTPRALGLPAVMFAVGYSPMLLANLVRPLAGLRLGLSRTYAVAPTLRPDAYAARLLDLLRTFVDSLAGGLAFERFAAPAALAAAVAAVLAGALIVEWQHGSRLPAFVLGVSMLTLPLAVHLFVPRYVTFLLPLAAAAIASAAVRISASRLALAAVVTGVLAASIAAVVRTEHYVAWAADRHLTNEAYFRLRADLVDRRACGARLFVEDVGQPRVNPAWNGLLAIDYVLTLTPCAHQLLTMDRIADAVAEPGDAWIVASLSTAAAWPGARLEPLMIIGAPAGQALVPIGLYRAGRSGR